MASNVTVSDCLDRYWQGHAKSRVVDSARIHIILKWLGRGFGKKLVSKVSDVHVNKYVADREAGVIGKGPASPGTIRRELSCLRTVFNYSVQQKLISDADVPHIFLPQAPGARDVWLSQAQVSKMLDFIAMHKGVRYPRVGRFVILALATGARKRSIETLRWGQVDLDSNQIRYDRQVQYQTRKRRVAVPITKWLLSHLREWVEEDLGASFDDYLLGDDKNIRHEFDALRKDLFEATGGVIYKRMTPHTLRHTAATQLLRSGCGLWEVAGLLGDSVETVAQTYGHHVKDHLQKAANRWDIGATA